ncbi:MAG: hypothetical protein COT35_06655 [Nitrospirae bacterium CG08_land_8_20_14_0_20_52_24]|nr:MAG: hypothetical protein AUK29_01455 [Nitrospirae bacterium CG2_30_53_67]PIS37307.1 MAG: hypothetical protein COT35_06655 [Nitrospirae bacterium CG08_land_8_20_14_0_20_52_24]PIV82437.1 MAG: hypothetical protein COW52_13580 [Nitrospirae bacterium CG17_big_fil_post_rev_8_21_14_2_50_50_9]PIW85165.1 MAG: hypothetical protein COZ95_06035 [Nitrospirae bacterium CG_4_8_14_3_um_filter_50_41]PIX85402.1 MAG: hypothetical protein COZ32_08695 [Nitrospirae bacterium CG_4_10_14_3_um_filter_53_41]
MFKINVHKIEEHTFILNLEGDLTVQTSVEFHNAITPILQREPKAISINLSNVAAMDEAGIVILMNDLMDHSGRGIYFYLIGLPEKIKVYYQACLQNFENPYFSNTTH